ncbi:MAG: hypothetical protein HY735_12840 [Verrucomicrobia bacterium]|nr:hypothetical protein [Verrucomicrobiota bacterium]
MRAIAALLGLAGCLVSQAQTNSPFAPLHLFALPDVPLRHCARDGPTATPSSVAPPLTAAISKESSENADSLEKAAQQYQYLNGRSLVTRVRQIDRGGFAQWAEEKIFPIEVVQFKGVKFAGSLVTAIKRKNPLYLLNPMVLAVAW